jgi:hypothetical protein
MAQEARAESVALVGAGDQSGHVGQHEAPLVVDPHDAQVRDERGERIVGDPRPRRRHRADERRLPHVRQPQQPRVGQHAKLEPERAPLARRAGIGAPGRAVGRGGEVHVAAPAAATVRHHRALAGRAQIGQHDAGLVVVDHRARRHAQHEVVAGGPVLILAATVLAPLRAQGLGIGEVEQGREAGIDAQDDVAAVAAVSPVRPAARDVLLAPEARTSAAAVACLDADPHLVDELHGPALIVAQGVPPRQRRRFLPARGARWARPARRTWANLTEHANSIDGWSSPALRVSVGSQPGRVGESP